MAIQTILRLFRNGQIEPLSSCKTQAEVYANQRFYDLRYNDRLIRFVETYIEAYWSTALFDKYRTLADVQPSKLSHLLNRKALTQMAIDILNPETALGAFLLHLHQGHGVDPFKASLIGTKAYPKIDYSRIMINNKRDNILIFTPSEYENLVAQMKVIVVRYSATLQTAKATNDALVEALVRTLPKALFWSEEFALKFGIPTRWKTSAYISVTDLYMMLLNWSVSNNTIHVTVDESLPTEWKAGFNASSTGVVFLDPETILKQMPCVAFHVMRSLYSLDSSYETADCQTGTLSYWSLTESGLTAEANTPELVVNSIECNSCGEREVRIF